jgi:hypothetical protein
MQQMIRTGTMVAMAAGLLAFGACGHKNTEPEHRTIEGVAESIDPSSNQVSMRWYNPRKQVDMKVVGTVTDQTEILINGRVARLEDIKLGEKVKVTGRIMKDSGSPQLIATRIEVTRESSPTSVPSTRPAKANE